jgi:hypothetical protein
VRGTRVDLGGEVIQNQIAALGSHDQHQMMLSRTDNDLPQQQYPRGRAAIEQFLAFDDRIVVTVFPVGPDQPGFGGETECIVLGTISSLTDLLAFRRSSHRSAVSSTADRRETRFCWPGD